MPASRIPAAESRRQVQILFDGSPIEAVEGEPVAASLLAADRLILSRSFRFHRPRGLMCSTGQCGWCECEVDGVPSVRTCRVPAREGLVVRTEHALPSATFDLLGALDVFSRLIPPTFYHHRFLRPRWLRKSYLDVVRWFGGRGKLPDAPRQRAAAPSSAGASEHRREAVDVVVVGAGPSGLAAAAAAARTGARVVVLEADAPPFWRAPGAAGSGEGGDGHGGEAGNGVEVRTGTTALGLYDGVLAAAGAGGTLEIDVASLVVATGSYERVPTVEGADRPGVLGATLVERLIEWYGIVPGKRAVLVGDDPDLERAHRLLEAAGADVIGPLPTSGLRAIEGRRRVWAARLKEDGATRIEQADVVVFGDRVPSVELLLAAGARMGWRDGRLEPVLDDVGRTSVAGLFAVGGAAGRRGDTTGAGRTGIAAALHAAGSAVGAWAGESNGVGIASSRRGRRTAGSEGQARPHGRAEAQAAAVPASPGGAFACFCEDVRVREIAAEIAAGYGDPELLKRRTGALTGPCQGKYCLPAVAAASGPAGDDVSGQWTPPTARPPVRPVRLGQLAGPHPLAGRRD